MRGTDAAERGLPDADDATVLTAMAAQPALIERPLVETDKGVRLCRPQDLVHEIL
jgi:arsenate reductase